MLLLRRLGSNCASLLMYFNGKKVIVAVFDENKKSKMWRRLIWLRVLCVLDWWVFLKTLSINGFGNVEGTTILAVCRRNWLSFSYFYRCQVEHNSQFSIRTKKKSLKYVRKLKKKMPFSHLPDRVFHNSIVSKTGDRRISCIFF